MNNVQTLGAINNFVFECRNRKMCEFIIVLNVTINKGKDFNIKNS